MAGCRGLFHEWVTIKECIMWVKEDHNGSNRMTGIGDTESDLGTSKCARGFYYNTSYLQVLYSTLSQLWIIHHRLWSFGGITLTGRNWNTQRKMCPSAILSTIHPTWTGLRLKSGPIGRSSKTNCPSNGMAHHQLLNHPIIKLDTTCNSTNNANFTK